MKEPGPGDEGHAEAEEGHPFPESLCHACAAPPKYIRNRRGSVFIWCPIFKRYPPQPVLECERFVPKPSPEGSV